MVRGSHRGETPLETGRKRHERYDGDGIMTDIVTVTPNPAVDVSMSVEKIIPVRKLRGSEPRRDPGGGGINVARVIKRLGGDVCAIYPVGGSTGDVLRKLLDREGVASKTFAIADETREDFFVSETATGQQYRFILPGPELSAGEWQECLDLLARSEPFPRFVVASGSLPRGVPDDFYARLARLAKTRGARMVVDTSGPALATAVAEGVDLIKPSLREMRELAGREPSDAFEWEDAARHLVRDGKVATVALTMGHLGAVLVTRDLVLRASALAIAPVSAVGAGDSFLGALIHGLAAGAALDDCFRRAVAAGAAALLNPGTGLCLPDDVERLAGQVIVRTAP
jgi:6-phosphofructokinase 2